MKNILVSSLMIASLLFPDVASLATTIQENEFKEVPMGKRITNPNEQNENLVRNIYQEKIGNGENVNLSKNEQQETEETKETPKKDEESSSYNSLDDKVTREAIYYYITFESNGGSDFPSQKLESNESIQKLYGPKRKHYTFVAWCRDPELKVEMVYPSPITGDMKLYAKWERNMLDVTFESNGGSKVTSQIVPSGEKVKEPTPPTKNNFQFGGWYKDVGLTQRMNFYEMIDQKMTLYAKWDEIKYNVTFNTNGGSAVPSQKVSKGQTAKAPGNPTKDGHKFLGWYKDATFNQPMNFSETINKDMTVYAKWDEITYNVTFNTNGGSAVSSQAVSKGKTAKEPVSPKKEHYNFVGWYKDPALNEAMDFSKIIEKDTTLYAKWEEITYNVTFNSNGGTTVSPQKILSGDKIKEPTNPTKEHYKFLGWYKDAALNEAMDFSEIVSKDMTLYAKWDETTYEVTFNSNGGSVVPSQKVMSGNTAKVPIAPTRDHYKFVGWYKDVILTQEMNFKDTIEKDTLLYAKWEKAKYTVSFDSNEGTAISEQQVSFGEKATEPPKPTKKDATFVGWYKDLELTQAMDFNETISKDMMLYAKWDQVKYTITFETNGGSIMKPQELKGGEKILGFVEPTKEHYTFAGWYQDPELTIALTYPYIVEKDMKLYAKWDEIFYTVKYDSNGGSTVSDQKVGSGKTTTEPVKPTKDHYKFMGWFSDKELTKPMNFASMIEKDTILYAKWDEIFYTVKYESNGGSTVSDQKVGSGKATTEPAKPTKEHYEFMGWFQDKELTKPMNFAGTIEKDTILYAKWDEIFFIVKYESNGGSKVMDQKVESGKATTEPTKPTKEHYKFLGWYKDQALKEAMDFSEIIKKNTTLYAKWDEITYNVTFDSNGGTSVLPQTVSSGSPANEPIKPTKKHYKFLGWYKDKDLKEAMDFSKIIEKDTTLYAKWDEIFYTVKYESNGGSKVTDQKVGSGKATTEPVAPTKEHYTFVGWFEDKDLTKPMVFTQTIEKDTVLYAKWNEIFYTVKYESNGGSKVTDQKVGSGKATTEPVAPTKKHYKFVGWFEDKELTKPMVFTEKIGKDTVLYAKWDEIFYTVKYESNGGSTVANQKVGSGKATTEPAKPTKEHYTFVGWFEDKDLTKPMVFTQTIEKDTVLYAKWDEIFYIVKYESNGGSKVTDQKVGSGKATTEPVAPTKENYKFVGWFEDKDLTQPMVFTKKIGKDTVLYAKWDEIFYTVKYESNGGSTVANQKVGSGKATTEPAKPTKEHYTFVGWFQDKDLTQPMVFTEMIKKDTILYAKWNEIFYTVKYESNGGSTVANQKVGSGKVTTEPAKPTKEHYTFVGWFEDKELTKPMNFTEKIGKDTILYAKWDEIFFSVVFESDGGTAVPAQKVGSGKLASEPASPTKEKHKFLGWFHYPELTQPMDFSKKIEKDTILYARWEKPRTVTFEVNGGSKIEPQIIAPDQPATEPSKPVRKHYTFAGWFEDKELTKPMDFTKNIEKDTTLYAKWDEIFYSVVFESDGGTAVPAQKVGSGKLASEPANPTKEKHKFLGWFSYPELTKPMDFSKEIEKDTILYARWEKPRTVTFETNGGSEIEPQVIAPDQPATEPSKPVREHYTFAGWFEDKELTKPMDFTANVGKDMVLYSKWDEIFYTVKYESNGGSAVTDQKVGSGKATTEPAAPTKEHYKFVGWFEDKELTKPMDFTAKIGKDASLFAKWEEVYYTVQFDSNGGTKIDPQKVASGKLATEPQKPEKENYTFMGWYQDPSFTKAVDFTEKIEKDSVLYAKWDPIAKPVVRSKTPPTQAAPKTRALPQTSELLHTSYTYLGALMVVAAWFMRKLRKS